jgi:aminoglycoside phosphotransferase (APT) family kinase protein
VIVMDRVATSANRARRVHPALRAWSRLPAAEGRVTAVEFLRRVRDGRMFRLRGAGTDGADVIATRLRPRRADRERVAYERVLPMLPSLPSLRYFGCVAEEDRPFHWLFVEEAGGESYSPARAAHREACARWLAEFQTRASLAFRGAADAGLPEQGVAWYADNLHAAAAAVDERRRDRHLARLLPAGAAELLDELARQCAIAAEHWDEVGRVCGSVPPTVVHGDLAARNLRVIDRGAGPELRVFDWEDLAWGPPALDLIRSDADATCDGANPDPAAYLAAVRRHWPGVDGEAVRLLGEVGRLFWLVLAVRLDAEALDAQWIERPVDHLRLYAAEMPQVLEALGWRA